jgi:nucleoside-diphosphate-sugar epimerase
MESYADTRAIEGLGWKSRISLEQGLRQTIDAERVMKSDTEVKRG